MKFTPSGSPLKSAQMHFKTASFGEGTKKLWGCKNYPYIYIGKWLTTAALNILNSYFMVTNMAALQYNVQSCMYLH